MSKRTKTYKIEIELVKESGDHAAFSISGFEAFIKSVEYQIRQKIFHAFGAEKILPQDLVLTGSLLIIGRDIDDEDDIVN
jgi:hypothetical protein